VVEGDWIFISGTTGFNYETGEIADNVVEQAERCFFNISAALAQAGFSFADVVRVRYFLPDPAEFESCWPVLRKYFGSIRPAATMLPTALSDPRMRIEIEVTGKRQSG
jgi:enamine deaminase RidA (YjgF/YER057c/UK114 family)